MSDQAPARARPWQALRRALGAIGARVARTLGRSLPAATVAPIHSTGDRTMTDHTTTTPASSRDDRTAVRHLRFNVTDWRRAATRAARDGRGIAEVAGALVRAYGAGELDAPPPAYSRPVHMLLETGRASRLAACSEPFANGEPGTEDPAAVTCRACLAITAHHHQTTPTEERS
jgi:hypothetical protein